ncbi:MAG: hypothetical protein U1E36_09065 [Rickettsiales bacterium]
MTGNIKQWLYQFSAFIVTICFFSLSHADEPTFHVKINCFPEEGFLTLDSLPVMYGINPEDPEMKKSLLEQDYFEARDLEKSPYHCTFKHTNSLGFEKNLKIIIEGKTGEISNSQCGNAGTENIRVVVNGIAFPWIDLSIGTCNSLYTQHHVEIFDGHVLQCTNIIRDGVAYNDFDSGKTDYKELPTETKCISRDYSWLLL